MPTSTQRGRRPGRFAGLSTWEMETQTIGTKNKRVCLLGNLAGAARFFFLSQLRQEFRIRTTKMIEIIQAETPEQIAIAREMMLEYATWLEFNLCFQGFEEELQTLPGRYAPPAG